MYVMYPCPYCGNLIGYSTGYTPFRGDCPRCGERATFLKNKIITGKQVKT